MLSNRKQWSKFCQKIVPKCKGANSTWELNVSGSLDKRSLSKTNYT